MLSVSGQSIPKNQCYDLIMSPWNGNEFIMCSPGVRTDASFAGGDPF